MSIDASAVARVLGITTQFKDLLAGGVLLLPQRIAIIAQGATSAVYATDKFQATKASDVGSKLGYGSPAHLIAKQLFPANGDGVGTIPVTFYPLDDDGAGVAASGDITPSGSPSAAETYKVIINNIESETFLVDAGAAVADITAAMKTAIDAVVEMPVTTVDNGTDLALTAKWKGASGNDIHVEVVAVTGDESVTYAITQPAGGATNPDVQPALDQFGNVWETLVLNAMDIADTSTLDTIQTHGDGRWGALVRKPYVAFTGNTETTVALATAVSDARKTDKINAQLVSPGSNDLPFVVAARQLARIAKVANNNPPTDYGAQRATGLTPGDDSDQWDYADRDSAVKKGSSTIDVRDGVVTIGDVVTFYHPDGEPTPAYRYVVDIVKLQNIIFNLDLIFAAQEWAGAPLIPDDQPTVNPNARKPRDAKAQVAAMLDSLGLNAIISDPKSAKDSTTAVINSGNPKRLDVETTVKLSGNTNIKDVTLNFGFYFGAQAAA